MEFLKLPFDVTHLKMDITRPRRPFLIAFLLLVGGIGILAWTLYAAVEHQKDNLALIAAIKWGDVKTVETLLDRGADPNTTDNPDTRTTWRRLLDLLLHKTHPEAGISALELVMHRYSPDDVGDRKKGEAMQLALIANGADPNVEGERGWTPLKWGCVFDNLALVKAALARRASVNVQYECGYTPLMLATRDGDGEEGDTEMVRALLAHGANANIKNQSGGTALLCALHDPPSRVVTVKLLLEHGADVNVKDIHGDTPLKCAVEENWSEVMSLLKQAGAKE